MRLLSFAALTLVLCSCRAGLPPSLQREIEAQNAHLRADQQELNRSKARFESDLAKASDLFQASSKPSEWAAKYTQAQNQLNAAQTDSQQIARLSEEPRVRQLLADEAAHLQNAEALWKAPEAVAHHWLSFRQDLPASLQAMTARYQSIHQLDLTAVSETVAKAGKDWPAKKADLESRLATLRDLPTKASAEWAATAQARQDAASGKATGAQIATLIETDDLLTEQAHAYTSGPAELTALSGQLYDSWDKILTDLDKYRERIKTVRTHLKETRSEEHWYNISEPVYRSLENDIGMTIAHKDVGLYDSEAQTIPQPPGYSYIAPPEQHSNQYGYWTNDHYGHSVWTWLPEYLILRELLWNRDYRPVGVSDYGAYRIAQRSGTSYYGPQTPGSRPTYGSHGTFTQTHYAESRYVQSGGFKNSSYASHASAPSAPRGSAPSYNSNSPAGKRYGRAPGSPPSGQRFGRPSGGGAGRGFGRRR